MLAPLTSRQEWKFLTVLPRAHPLLAALWGSFDTWIAGTDARAWPHDLGDGSLAFAGETVYEMRCGKRLSESELPGRQRADRRGTGGRSTVLERISRA